jgi:hypothetical protein
MNTIEMLNALADYQAQRDLLDLQKRELLDAVKVPAEVIAAQEEANQRKRRIDADYNKIQEVATAKKMQELETIVIPPEVRELVEAIGRQRQEIERATAIALREAWSKAGDEKEEIDRQLGNSIAGIYNEINARKAEIEAEFGDKAAAVDENIAKLTAEIKAAVIAEGETVKADHYQAVYTPGKTTWKTDTLDKVYFALNTLAKALADLPWHSSVKLIIDDMTKARKVGDPYVTLRKIG